MPGRITRPGCFLRAAPASKGNGPRRVGVADGTCRNMRRQRQVLGRPSPELAAALSDRRTCLNGVDFGIARRAARSITAKAPRTCWCYRAMRCPKRSEEWRIGSSRYLFSNLKVSAACITCEIRSVGPHSEAKQTFVSTSRTAGSSRAAGIGRIALSICSGWKRKFRLEARIAERQWPLSVPGRSSEKIGQMSQESPLRICLDFAACTRREIIAASPRKSSVQRGEIIRHSGLP